jgi:hypothetical protein
MGSWQPVIAIDVTQRNLRGRARRANNSSVTSSWLLVLWLQALWLQALWLQAL